MPSSTKTAWLQANRRQTKVISFGCTPSSQICSKCLRASLPCPYMDGTTSKYGSPSYYILRWHLVEHSLSFLNAPTLCIHVNQATAHAKTSDSKSLWMTCWWTYLLFSIATMVAHAFSTPTKVTEFGHTPSCCICWNSSSAFCPWSNFTCPNIMAVKVSTFRDGILLNTLQACSMLPHFAYMSKQATPRKTSDLQPVWISCLEQACHLQVFLNQQSPEQKWIC